MSNNMQVLLSIITINKNNNPGLIKTIESVIYQTFSDIEFIVVDGNSSDGSIETISRYHQSFTKVIIEDDHGIYDAMNKGILQSTGTYTLFLNSGDILAKHETLQNVFKAIRDEDLIYGDIFLQTPDAIMEYFYPAFLDFRYILNYVIPHQASFIRRELFIKIGLYNTTFKIVSDWEWTVRLLAFQNINYKHISEFITIYDTTGLSFQPGNQELIKSERKEAIERIFSKSLIEMLKETSAPKPTSFSKTINRLFPRYFK